MTLDEFDVLVRMAGWNVDRKHVNTSTEITIMSWTKQSQQFDVFRVPVSNLRDGLLTCVRSKYDGVAWSMSSADFDGLNAMNYYPTIEECLDVALSIFINEQENH